MNAPIRLCEIRIIFDDFCVSTFGLTDPIAEAILELLRLTEDAGVKICSVSRARISPATYMWLSAVTLIQCACPFRKVHAGLHVLQYELDLPKMTIALHVAILHSQLFVVKQELFFRAQAGKQLSVGKLSGRGRRS